MPELQRNGKLVGERTHEFSPLESWSVLPIATMRCTRLYPLEPMAYRTPEVEALSSFIAELADRHCVSVNDLVSRELVSLMRPVVPESALPYHSRTQPLQIKFAGWQMINAGGGLASRAVLALEQATGVTHLDHLTMLPLGGYIAPRMISPKRKWCSLCLNAFRKEGRPFEPLIWSISTVSACFAHRIPLELTCPKCGGSSAPLHRFSRAGFCSRCGEWLGSDSDEVFGQFEPDHPMVKAAVLTSELVGNLPNIPPFQGQNNVQRNLRRLIELTVDGNQKAFFSACGLPKQYQVLTLKLPTLKMLVAVAVRLNIPLAFFFNSDFDQCDTICRSVADRLDQTVLNCLRSRKKIISLLRTAFNASPPVSLNDVARELGYRSTIPLYRADRALACSICSRFLDYSRTPVEKTQKMPRPSSDAIREALKRALLEHEPPSVTAVAKRLGFFNPHALVGNHRELCDALLGKRDQYREAQLKRLEAKLISALKENPAPSLGELIKRCGLKTNDKISVPFPKLAAELIQKRKDQRLERLASTRESIEELLRRPEVRWNQVLEITGLSRGSIAKNFSDLMVRINGKNKDTMQAKRIEAFNIAKEKIRLIVKELELAGVQPSIKVVCRAIPTDQHYGRGIVEKTLRILDSEAAVGP